MAGRAVLTIGLGIVVYALALRGSRRRSVRSTLGSRARAARGSSSTPGAAGPPCSQSRMRVRTATRPRSRSGSRSATTRSGVGRCIESVLAQDLTDLELVICDNASDDDTAGDAQELRARGPPGHGQPEPDQHRLAREHEPRARSVARDAVPLDQRRRLARAGGPVDTRVRRSSATPDAIGVTSGFTIHTPGAAPRFERYAGEFPMLLGPRRALRAHALVLPRRRRQVRPDLRDLPARAADAHRTRASERAHRLAAERRARAHAARSCTSTSCLPTARRSTRSRSTGPRSGAGSTRSTQSG